MHPESVATLSHTHHQCKQQQKKDLFKFRKTFGAKTNKKLVFSVLKDSNVSEVRSTFPTSLILTAFAAAKNPLNSVICTNSVFVRQASTSSFNDQTIYLIAQVLNEAEFHALREFRRNSSQLTLASVGDVVTPSACRNPLLRNRLQQKVLERRMPPPQPFVPPLPDMNNNVLSLPMTLSYSYGKVASSPTTSWASSSTTELSDYSGRKKHCIFASKKALT